MMNWTALLADNLINRLKAWSNRLNLGLDRAIYKLDKFRRQLILQFYRALQVMEKLFKVTWEIIQILVPILATFSPPILGIGTSFFLLSPASVDGIILLTFSGILLLILIFAYLTTNVDEDANYKVLQAEERLIYVSDLREYSRQMRLFGAALIVGVFVVLWFIYLGLFLGVLLFVLEFVIILLLPKIYKVPGGGPPTDPASR